MVEGTDTQRTGRGTVGGTGIVLDAPLDLPEGTQVVVSVRVLKSANLRQKTNDGSLTADPSGELTDAQLHEWARNNPAPQEWWDSTDNPFLPEDAPENQPRRPEGPIEGR